MPDCSWASISWDSTRLQPFSTDPPLPARSLLQPSSEYGFWQGVDVGTEGYPPMGVPTMMVPYSTWWLMGGWGASPFLPAHNARKHDSFTLAHVQILYITLMSTISPKFTVDSPGIMANLLWSPSTWHYQISSLKCSQNYGRGRSSFPGTTWLFWLNDSQYEAETRRTVAKSLQPHIKNPFFRNYGVSQYIHKGNTYL